MFYDRQHAGKLLVQPLKKFANQKDTIILALPRGGVVTAYEAASALKIPLDIISPRKVGAPGNPEFAIGAVDETGTGFFDEALIKQLGVSDTYLKETIEREKANAQHRLDLYRQNKPPLNLKNKTVILIDDGLATGATMKAAIQSVKAKGAKSIIVAVPVAPAETLSEIQAMADEVICLNTPKPFFAVGQFYQNFEQTEDDEVISLLRG